MDELIGMLVYATVATIPPHYLPADGRCVSVDQYPSLAEVLHNGDDWPYGRCEDHGFRIPDLTPKSLGRHGGDPIPLIRVD
jgi:hypothetical protein